LFPQKIDPEKATKSFVAPGKNRQKLPKFAQMAISCFYTPKQALMGIKDIFERFIDSQV
jgi:hypothetical protein